MKLIIKICYILIVFPIIIKGQEWEKVYDFGLNDFATSIYPTNDSCYIVSANWQSSPTDYNVIVLKIDEYGDTVWTKKYGDTINYENINDIVVKNDNSILVVGKKQNLEATYLNDDLWLINLDSNGNIIWDSMYDIASTNSDDWGKSIILDHNNNIVIGGNAQVYVGVNEALIMKLDSIGDYFWYDIFGGATSYYSRGYGFSVCETFNHDYLITGRINQPAGVPNYGFIRKYDNLGNLMSNLTFVDLFIKDIVISSDSNYVFIAEGINEAVIRKISETNLLWHLSLPNIYLNSIIKTTDGNYITTGNHGSDFFLLKFNNSGDTLWSQRTNATEGFSVCNSFSNNSYIVVGEMSGDIYIAKFTDPVPVEELTNPIKEENIKLIHEDGSIKFVFFLENSVLVSLKVYDVTGRIVFQNDNYYTRGQNTIDSRLPVSNVYLYNLYINNKIIAGKIINIP